MQRRSFLSLFAILPFVNRESVAADRSVSGHRKIVRKALRKGWEIPPNVMRKLKPKLIRQINDPQTSERERFAARRALLAIETGG